MWIELSKILPYLVFPLTIFMECLVIAWLLRRFGVVKIAALMKFLGFAILITASLPFTAAELIKRLEGWYQPVPAASAPAANVIILLGGGLSLPLSPRVDAELNEASDRILYAARLYHARRAPRILVTGGNVFKQDEAVRTESEYVKELLVEWGVPPNAILLETESRNTRENAVNSSAILAKHGVKSALLVTSAFHMPRAAATFQAVGIEATPLPVDYAIVDYSQPVLLDLLPSAGALAGTTHALREYLGTLIYGLRGWLKAA